MAVILKLLKLCNLLLLIVSFSIAQDYVLPARERVQVLPTNPTENQIVILGDSVCVFKSGQWNKFYTRTKFFSKDSGVGQLGNPALIAAVNSLSTNAVLRSDSGSGYQTPTMGAAKVDVITFTTAIGNINTALGTKVGTGDIRLVDERTPLAHTHVKASITDFAHTHPESEITNLTTDLTSKLSANAAIIGGTKTKITYDGNGLVTGGANATSADIAASTDKNYVTDAQLTVIGNTSGINTGNQTTVSGNAGTATTFQTARNINGVSFNGSADITVVAAAGTLTGTALPSGITSAPGLTSVAGGTFGSNAFNSTAYLTGNQSISILGDASGSGSTSISLTVSKINGTSLAGLTTGILKNTTTTGHAKVWGIVRINSGGTLIPQVSLGVAAAAVVGVNSYFRIVPIGTNTVTNVGNWN